ncbi:MAG: lipase [Gammaproteobacteria bacterium]|jgi:pimeloyl-ACP methyl ester carboxylesterase|nr:lipase [Gammaproteobacteria bacterium]
MWPGFRTLFVCILLGAPAPGFAEFNGCPVSAQVFAGTPELGAGGLSPDFRSWLADHGYDRFDFARDDLEGGSFGGRQMAAQALHNQPVVFVHGNSDRAAGHSAEGPLGWTAVIRQFLDAGYTPAELYASTWGPADQDKASEQVHSVDHVRRIRSFMEAVLAYTGAKQMDVIAHSMGVTLARRAILGGELDGQELGPPLTDRIDTFVGIAGANRGLATCVFARRLPTCSDHNGLFPGYTLIWGVTGLSDYLAELEARSGFEGAHVYSIWSRADQLIGFGGLVYGEYTSRIPGQEGEKVYAGNPYGHFCVRDLSAGVQLEMVRNHRLPP